MDKVIYIDCFAPIMHATMTDEQTLYKKAITNRKRHYNYFANVSWSKVMRTVLEEIGDCTHCKLCTVHPCTCGVDSGTVAEYGELRKTGSWSCTSSTYEHCTVKRCRDEPVHMMMLFSYI